MGIGVSIFLIAVGAVLAFAIHVASSGVDLNTIGVILMIVGLIGALISVIFWSSWGGFGRTYPAEGRYVRDDRLYTADGRVVRDDRLYTADGRVVRDDRVMREERRVP